MGRPSPQCGTYGGYQKHRRLGQETCPECREACREYISEFRKRKPRVLSQQQRQTRLRNRALARLRELHEEEYAAIYAQVAAEARSEP